MIQSYLEYQEKVKNLSPRTCGEYRKDLGVFCAWLESRGRKLTEVTKATVDAYLMDEHERGMQPETIKKRLSAVRNFYQWAKHEGIVSENPAWFCQSPKRVEKLPKTADVAQLDKYLGTPIFDDQSARVHLLVALLMETGLRLTEALSIRRCDIDMSSRCIVIFGKGRKERVVFYGERTARMLQGMPPMGDHVLEFSSERQLRRELTDEVGVYVDGVHPHMLRHTFATALLNNGIALKDLSVLMGHAHVTTTERYARVALVRQHAEYSRYMF